MDMRLQESSYLIEVLKKKIRYHLQLPAYKLK
jgi:hypothetical protein